jgi:GTPase
MREHVGVINSIFLPILVLILRNDIGQNSKCEETTYILSFGIAKRSFIAHLPAYCVLNRLLYLWEIS